MSLIDFCQDINLPFRTSGHHHTREGWVQMHCPFCGGGKSGFDLGFNVNFGSMNCWRCGRHSLWDFLLLVSPNQYPRDLITKYSLRDKQSVAAKKPVAQTIPFPKLQHSLSHAARSYLSARNFNPEALSALWSIQSTTLTGRERNRLFIPIQTGEQIVSFTCRSLGEAEPKYLNALPEQEITPLKHCLYGENMVWTPFVFVCEGPFDVWRIGPPAVATFGTQVTTEQIVALSHYPTIVLLFDNDGAGYAAEKRLVPTLELIGSRVMCAISNLAKFGRKDPADLTKEERDSVRKTLFELATQGEPT